jgi:S-DNA-T family DNA segregation ATPase FtsK/SpoIIIE
VPVLRVRPWSTPGTTAAQAPEAWAAAGDVAAVAAWVDRLDGRFGVVCADDVGGPGDVAGLLALPSSSSENRVALVAAGSAGQLATHFQGPVSALRRSRSGLLLCPGPPEAEVLGFRLPRTPVPVRPGSGWLVTSGVPVRVQVARRRTPAGLP